MSTTPIESLVQKPELDPMVELYEFDLTPLGVPKVFYFTPTLNAEDPNQSIVFGGKLYTAIPMKAEGFEWSGAGPLPTPMISLSNALNGFSAMNVLYGDMKGAEIKKITTFARYLDNGSDPSQEDMFPIEIYRINRKVDQNGVFVVYELCSSLDLEGVRLPGRIFLANHCDHVYRRFDVNSGEFNYLGVTCPYAKAPTFDRNGVPCEDEDDECGLTVEDCTLRFDPTRAGHEIIEFRGCPGLSHTPL